MDSFGVYIHVPFCATRCGYCDFNTYTAEELGPGASRADFRDGIRAELDLSVRVLERAAVPGRPVETVFFGGGSGLLAVKAVGLMLRR